jgi:hypothetical protein
MALMLRNSNYLFDLFARVVCLIVLRQLSVLTKSGGVRQKLLGLLAPIGLRKFCKKIPRLIPFTLPLI